MTLKNFNLTMLTLTALFFCGYLTLIMILVTSAVARQQAVERLAELTPAVTSLESEYVVLSGKITLDLAYQLGFKDAAESTYALLTKSSVY
ncbi:MAG: hypothetical protein HYT48_01205 [Candidatus Vogelbacteria bacterium]|nr:hypothetical protein [Candidatus Vogelbacteria bacterium]